MLSITMSADIHDRNSPIKYMQLQRYAICRQLITLWDFDRCTGTIAGKMNLFDLTNILSTLQNVKVITNMTTSEGLAVRGGFNPFKVRTQSKININSSTTYVAFIEPFKYGEINRRVDPSILISWKSPSPILGVSGVLFHFNSIFNRYSC